MESWLPCEVAPSTRYAATAFLIDLVIGSAPIHLVSPLGREMPVLVAGALVRVALDARRGAPPSIVLGLGVAVSVVIDSVHDRASNRGPDDRANDVAGCPSSDDLGLESLISTGGSGSVVFQSMPLSGDAASGAFLWSWF